MFSWYFPGVSPPCVSLAFSALSLCVHIKCLWYSRSFPMCCGCRSCPRVNMKNNVRKTTVKVDHFRSRKLCFFHIYKVVPAVFWYFCTSIKYIFFHTKAWSNHLIYFLRSFTGISGMRVCDAPSFQRITAQIYHGLWALSAGRTQCLGQAAGLRKRSERCGFFCWRLLEISCAQKLRLGNLENGEQLPLWAIYSADLPTCP